MLASPTFPATPVGLVGGLMYRIVAFLALRLRGADAGTIPAVTPETRARILAFAARLLAFTRDFARLAALVRSGEQRAAPAPASRRRRACGKPAIAAVVGAGAAARRARAKFGWMLEFVPTQFRDAFAEQLTGETLAGLMRASPAASRRLRWLAHGLGVTVPPGTIPTGTRSVADAANPASEATGEVTHGSPDGAAQAAARSHASGAPGVAASCGNVPAPEPVVDLAGGDAGRASSAGREGRPGAKHGRTITHTTRVSCETRENRPNWVRRPAWRRCRAIARPSAGRLEPNALSTADGAGREASQLRRFSRFSQLGVGGVRATT